MLYGLKSRDECEAARMLSATYYIHERDAEKQGMQLRKERKKIFCFFKPFCQGLLGPRAPPKMCADLNIP